MLIIVLILFSVISILSFNVDARIFSQYVTRIVFILENAVI